jgi:hypothetical protein
MKWLGLLSATLLTGCVSAAPHSWLVKDNGYQQCYYIYSSPIYVDGRIHWYTLSGKSVKSSNDFDLAVVRNEDYQEAAEALDVDLGTCSNGLR